MKLTDAPVHLVETRFFILLNLIDCCLVLYAFSQISTLDSYVFSEFYPIKYFGRTTEIDLIWKWFHHDFQIIRSVLFNILHLPNILSSANFEFQGPLFQQRPYPSPGAVVHKNVEIASQKKKQYSNYAHISKRKDGSDGLVEADWLRHLSRAECTVLMFYFSRSWRIKGILVVEASFCV